MKLKEFLLRQLMIFFVLVTLITVVIMIMGVTFDPDAELRYSSMASPLVFAALGVLPGLVMYSGRELSVRQVMIRKVIQLVLIEAEVLADAYLSPDIHTEQGATVAALALSVIVIFAIVNAASYLTDFYAAKKLTAELAEFQNRRIDR